MHLSLQKGIFPKIMKIAKDVRIYKTGDRHTFTNYRPVCFLSQFLKILEILFYKRLNDFVIKYDILSKQQCGVKSNITTSHA